MDITSSSPGVGKRVCFLVDGFLSSAFEEKKVCFRALDGSQCSWEVFLPVMPNGRVHELVEVPACLSKCNMAVFSIADERLLQLTVRRTAWFERGWRMANRVFHAFIRIHYSIRQACGLSFSLAFFNLSEAYRRVSVLRRVEDYQSWHRRFGILGDKERMAILNTISRFSYRPRFQLLVRGGAENPRGLKHTLDSINRQLYDEYVCVIFGGGESADVVGDADSIFVGGGARAQNLWLGQMNVQLHGASCNDWFISIRAGDRLPLQALSWFAAELQVRTDISVMYSDHDTVDHSGETIDACFKPDWSLTHYRSAQFVGDALLIKGEAIANAGGFDEDCLYHGFYDLLLRVLDADNDEISPFHVPAILYSSLAEEFTYTSIDNWAQAAVERHFQRRQIAARVTKLSGGRRRCSFNLPDDPPLVSIIIPTRDCLNLLRQCVESLLTRTTYQSFEILVIDNQSIEPDTLKYLRSLEKFPRVRVLRYDRPFNYSAMNNFAVTAAAGELLCLLNNDTEVISPDWLEEMVGHAMQPRVGAVGAKLYYPDGRVQHAGDVVGAGGCANHLHSMIARDDPGYCNRAIVAQDLSAVTAACLLTWKSIYLAMGGLDARFLRVAFNDVDYCLKLGQAGYKVIWTPHAELFHHESVSRGKERGWRKIFRAESEVFVMRRRWKRMMSNDPFYNPNLSYVRPDFSMGHFRQVAPPWR